jgi:asparagine synthase (glutamine-hydrolysing)
MAGQLSATRPTIRQRAGRALPGAARLWRSARNRAVRGRERASLSATSRGVIDERLTYLGPTGLLTLERCAHRARRERVPGDFIEAGVALGGSAVVLTAAMDGDRCFHGFDVFGMIPPPSDADPPEVHERYRTISEGRSSGIRGDQYYGYADDLYERVVATFARYGQAVDGRRVSLHRGLFQDTLHPQRPVALAHVDCDWHDPVRLCLERIWPALSPGGVMVFDDYNTYGGCATAVDAFLVSQPAAELVQTDPTAVVRKAPVPEAHGGAA